MLGTVGAQPVAAVLQRGSVLRCAHCVAAAQRAAAVLQRATAEVQHCCYLPVGSPVNNETKCMTHTKR